MELQMSRLMNLPGVLRLFKHIPWLKFICNWLICNVQLLILWAMGILVIVRCFSHRESFDKEIAAHLGSSFPRMPYIILVVRDSISCFLFTAYYRSGVVSYCSFYASFNLQNNLPLEVTGTLDGYVTAKKWGSEAYTGSGQFLSYTGQISRSNQ